MCAIERFKLKAAGDDDNCILWTGPKGPDRRRLVIRWSDGEASRGARREVLALNKSDTLAYGALSSGVLLLCFSCVPRVLLVSLPGLSPLPAAHLHRRGGGCGGDKGRGSEHAEFVFPAVDLLHGPEEDLRAREGHVILILLKYPPLFELCQVLVGEVAQAVVGEREEAEEAVVAVVGPARRARGRRRA